MPRVVFVTPGGQRREIDAPAGKSILEIAWANDIDIEGACEGCMACVINCPTDTIVNEVAQQHRLETALG